MKPSFTPCSFSNLSLYRLRRSITACILTSLNVVRMALSCCDCNKRSATRARKRLMGTRCSGRPSSDCVMGTVGLAKGAAFAAGATDAVDAFSASPFVIRPSRPEPATEAVDTPLSARIFEAAGDAIAPEAAAETGAATAVTGAATAAAGAAAGAAAALPSVSIRARTSPEVTMLPFALTISDSTPEAGAGTSSTTLSVSTSIKISSASTACPGCFFQVRSVASDTDSDNCGTTTFVIVIIFFSVTR